MSLSELYSAMVEQQADRLAADRRRRQASRTPIIVEAPKPVADADRIRALELENAEIKAGFAAFVGLLMKKGIIEGADVQDLISKANGRKSGPKRLE